MNQWLSSMNPKRHQRAMNRLVRKANKAWEEDTLWLGRFIVRQVESPQFVHYFDKSGAELYVNLEFVDRCTGNTYRTYGSVNYWRHMHGSNLYWKMNWFITEYCKVWDEPLAAQRNYDAWKKYNKETRVV